MNVKIGTVEYEIINDRLDDNDIGQISYRKALITIDERDMHPQVKRQVMCHEIAHAMMRVVTDNEVAAEALGNQLLMFLRDELNEEVIEFLRK